MMISSRRWFFFFALPLALAGLFVGMSLVHAPTQRAAPVETAATVRPRPSPATKSAAPSAEAAEAEVAAEAAQGAAEKQQEWPRWGGALNSAARDGAGFFDARQAAEFYRDMQRRKPAEAKYVLRLNARALLPEENRVEKALPGADAKAETEAYLQFKEHPSDAQRAALKASGIELETYVTAYAWTARGTHAAFERAARLENVRAVATVDPRDKLHAGVFRGQVPKFAALDAGRACLWVLARPGTTAAGLSAALRHNPNPAVAGLEPKLAYESSLGPQFQIAAAPALAEQIASLRDVAYIEYCPPPARSRDAITDDQHNVTDVRDNGPLLDGSGVKVAVREIGRPAPHDSFASRLTYVQSGVTVSSEVNHATGVVGLVAGDGNGAPKGVAPGSSVLAYAVNDDGNTFGTGDVVDAAAKGARISNHSYGPTGPDLGLGEYRTISSDWDNAARTNDLIAFYANYENGTPPGLKSTDYFVGAKNTICVNSSSAAAHAGDLNPPAAPANGISSFDGKGTMNDGRIKPDLAAYGENVGLCSGTSGSAPGSGTSFATPTCTGAAALIMEYYKSRVGADPSAALMKGLLCNSATDLGNPGPDANYGFGLLNVEGATNTIDQRQSVAVGPFVEGALSNGQTFSFAVKVQGSLQLKATLCWMDPGGNPASAVALVNDLDIEIVAPDGSTKFYPYSLSAANAGNNATNTGKNSVDPIEQIAINTPADGTYTVNVTAASIPAGTQSFAVVLNQATEPLPLIPQLLASPTKGPAPLAVAFSGNGSTGNIARYDWNFGDGSSGSGINISHTYAAPGVYTVTLTITDLSGKTATATRTIQVTRREVEVFASRLRLRLNFSRSGRDSLLLSIVVPERVMTAQQYREAVRSGELEGQTLALSIGGTELQTFTTDEKGRVRSRTELLRQSPTRGEIRIQIRNSSELQAIFSQLGMTADPGSSGLKSVPIQLDTDDASYKAVFTPEYKNRNGRSGTARQ